MSNATIATYFDYDNHRVICNVGNKIQVITEVKSHDCVTTTAKQVKLSDRSNGVQYYEVTKGILFSKAHSLKNNSDAALLVTHKEDVDYFLKTKLAKEFLKI